MGKKEHFIMSDELKRGEKKNVCNEGHLFVLFLLFVPACLFSVNRHHKSPLSHDETFVHQWAGSISG